MQAPLDVTVLRSGIPDTVPGRSMNVCERGIAAMLAGELVPGETVGVEIELSSKTEPLRTKATVRYQDELRCGLEFVAMSAEQRAAIRDWAKEANVGAEIGAVPPRVLQMKEKDIGENESSSGASRPVRRVKSGRRRRWWLIALVLVAIGGAVVWARWTRTWQELESGLKSSDRASLNKPRAQVPAEVMQKLLVHRVEPVYPAEARKDNLQGIIAIDIVVGREGSVLSMRALNGPEVLARAAMDALRWWKFEPYRLNGEPVVVETTVAVEFKR